VRIARRLFGALALAASLVTGPVAAPALAANDDGLVKIPPVARVTDLTGTLSAAQKSSLDQELAQFEQRKGSQIAVLMLPSTKPETIDQYGIRVADSWKLGRKGVDDGLILIVAKDDRQVRFEVGRGLEGPVTDILASRVIREIIAPHFLAGDYFSGIEDGVERIIGLVDGEQLPLPPPRSHRSRNGGNSLQSMLVIGFVLVFVVGGLLIRLLGRVLGSGLIGVVAAILAFVLLGGLTVAVIAGIVGFIAALIFGGSGFGGFGGFGGGGFGGGGGGGGFSGGGGGFGGGGASGSW
jgi:uncharacterized protein